MRSAFLVLLFAAPAAAQNLAEPQYQLTGKDYANEAPALQQMLYNVASALKQANTANTKTANAGASYALLAGNNVMSGSNTFTAPTTLSTVTFSGLVAVSSRSVNLQGITFTSTTYSLGVSTLTLTLSGANPVMVCFSGGVNCGATNGNFGWGFLYDGLYISPQSATVGVSYGHGYAGSGFTTPTDSGCFLVPVSSLSSGSHRFIMTAICDAGALTFGQSNGTVKTEDHFFVYELH